MVPFPQNRSWLAAPFVVLLAALFLATTAHADSDSHKQRSMTGVWFTKTPPRWIVLYELGTLAGEVGMRWKLEEDENGLVSGFNICHSPNPEEGALGIGGMCMVGARNGSSVVIAESQMINPDVPTFVFNCTHRRGNKARCLGNGLSVQPPVALNGNMTRVKNPGELDNEIIVIDEIREHCANGSRDA